MTQEYKTEFGVLRIKFPGFWTCKDYNEIKTYEPKESQWIVATNFKVNKIDSEWDGLIITIRIALSRQYDGYKIAELITETSCRASAGMKFEHKYMTLKIALNETLAHAQGAWTVKNTNPVIANELPQGHNKSEELSLELKEQIYHLWV